MDTFKDPNSKDIVLPLRRSGLGLATATAALFEPGPGARNALILGGCMRKVSFLFRE